MGIRKRKTIPSCDSICVSFILVMKQIAYRFDLVTADGPRGYNLLDLHVHYNLNTPYWKWLQ